VTDALGIIVDACNKMLVYRLAYKDKFCLHAAKVMIFCEKSDRWSNKKAKATGFTANRLIFNRY
jgi:hypothetical protein